MEKQRHIQSILRLRQSDPPGLGKGDPKKLNIYENIEARVVYGEMYDFEKVPKKSFATENSDFNQLDFPINKMMFITSQYQIVDQFQDKEEFKRLKIRFHAVVGKEEEEVWSLVKIVRVLSISKDILFEEVLQNFHYHVVRADNTTFNFSIADFQS